MLSLFGRHVTNSCLFYNGLAGSALGWILRFVFGMERKKIEDNIIFYFNLLIKCYNERESFKSNIILTPFEMLVAASC
jgi:hypothetical protein